MNRLELIISFAGLLLSIIVLLFFEVTITTKIIHILITVLFTLLIYGNMLKVKRIKKIVVQLQDVFKGNLNRRIYITTNNEYSELVTMINQLINSLQKEIIKNRKYQENQKSFLLNISHDIRTPLTSILGYAEALKDDLAIDKFEKEKYIEILVTKAKKLKKLVDGLFLLARIKSDELELNFQVYDLAEVTRECIIDFLPEINKKGLDLITDLPDKKCSVYADRLSLERIINNLLKNSLNYGKEGGVIGVQIISENKRYVLKVWDRGPGIRKEDIPHIFNRFYVGSKTDKRISGNSGLGLAITRKLVEIHNGRIEVESKPFEKTVFSIYFPAI